MAAHQSPLDPPEQQLAEYRFRFPTGTHELDQDEEWCEYTRGGAWEKVRFHDYHLVYRVPGLYEALFYRRLKCCSPARVVGLLDDVYADFPGSNSDLRALDMGAGNGLVGEHLRGMGVSSVVGLDILEEARVAAERDRPAVYDDYLVADLTDLSPHDAARVKAAELNCLSCVAALGYGDIPPLAFINACNLIQTPGWLAFNIKETFLEGGDPSGFCGLVHQLTRQRYIQVQAYRRYCHRLSLRGEPLYYVAIIATKLRDIPPELAIAREAAA